MGIYKAQGIGSCRVASKNVPFPDNSLHALLQVEPHWMPLPSPFTNTPRGIKGLWGYTGVIYRYMGIWGYILGVSRGYIQVCDGALSHFFRLAACRGLQGAVSSLGFKRV